MGYHHFFYRGSHDGIESLLFTHLPPYRERYWEWYMAEEQHYTAPQVSKLDVILYPKY